MKTSLKTKLLTFISVLLIVIPIASAGCQRETAPTPAPSPAELSTTLVPNVPLDIYLYARQSRPTTVPAKMVNTPQDTSIESLAIWGVPAADDFAFGMALTLTSNEEASKVYSAMTLPEDAWKKLSGNTIYLVQGPGHAAESLKTAISNNDFKHYDDSEALQATAFLPGGSTFNPAAIATAKPSDMLINLLAQNAGNQGLGQLNLILKLMNLKVIAAGLYSPRQINLAEISEAIDSGSSIYDLDLGVVVLVRSGFPGFIVEPTVKKFLVEAKFAEVKSGELTLYKGTWETDGGKGVPVLIKVEGNDVFIALSGQESYAETLISNLRQG
ncbi:MAG: hypothetical protein HY530_08575 [Chloroflexi bacterium]|nr:hypothetical protein [Chloroflexota bacterium]